MKFQVLCCFAQFIIFHYESLIYSLLIVPLELVVNISTIYGM